MAGEEAANARLDGAIDARVAAVVELTLEQWKASGRQFPSYTRATMPVVITSLYEQGNDDGDFPSLSD